MKKVSIFMAIAAAASLASCTAHTIFRRSERMFRTVW